MHRDKLPRPHQTVDAALQALKQSGVDVIYSSELVRPAMVGAARARPATRRCNALSKLSRLTDSRCARWAPIPTSSCVRRRPDAVISDEPMDEVSVYASRYAIAAGLAEPRDVDTH